MMTSLKIFFEAYKYLTNCVHESLKSLNRDNLRSIFEILIEGREKGSSIIVDGQGRSLQSALIMEDSLEHNGFPIIFPVSNPNLRPWSKGDIFFFNSGSGSGSPVTHAQAAAKDGLFILGMTYNADIKTLFKDTKSGILTLIPSMNRNKLYAPLGTEFEFASAVIGACIGYGVGKTVEESMLEFDKCSQTIVDLFNNTVSFYEDNLDAFIEFINIINQYLQPKCMNKVYFRGVGRDSIINQVCAIRYGHLHKMVDGNVTKDLQVIAEGHWDLRKERDLAIITSGSGSTSQTLDYAMQAFISGLKVFGITSFEDSDLGRFTNRVDGCLVVPGRHAPFSMYNMVSKHRTNYLPEFELNCYLTMDSLLAQIASDHGITENDMKASHRLKTLE
jgi:D-arabinose 5-phosphate isomerase GutQ